MTIRATGSQDPPMRKLKSTDMLPLFVFINMIAPLGFSQSPPALLIAPSKATILVGETHTFRAVGKDGRMRHDARWSVSPVQAATLTTEGDEAILEAKEPSSAVLLTAYAGGDTAEARIEIRSGTSLPMGTVKWSVTELPGCKTTKITPAVPSANGPDIYVQETCVEGTFIRAILDDGREIWRRKIGETTVPPIGISAKDASPQAEHIDSNPRSICDIVPLGLTKDTVSALARERNLLIADRKQDSIGWEIEERGARCKIIFDSAGIVVKKRKTIITD